MLTNRAFPELQVKKVTNDIVKLFGPECLETGEVSAIFELDGERHGFFGSLERVENLVKANGGDVLAAIEKDIRREKAEWEAEAEREAEKEQIEQHWAGVKRDILTGRLKPQQNPKTGKWELDLGSVGVESDDEPTDTLELVRYADEAMQWELDE